MRSAIPASRRIRCQRFFQPDGITGPSAGWPLMSRRSRGEIGMCRSLGVFETSLETSMTSAPNADQSRREISPNSASGRTPAKNRTATTRRSSGDSQTRRHRPTCAGVRIASDGAFLWRGLKWTMARIRDAFMSRLDCLSDGRISRHAASMAARSIPPHARSRNDGGTHFGKSSICDWYFSDQTQSFAAMARQ